MSKIRILLLTNRDSDNVGDQLIEASVLSIIRSVMRDLDVPSDGYVISSKAAGIISKAYMATGEPALLKPARDAVSKADVIIFGGAPLLNYAYQDFYRRTIKTIELAKEYGVPVLMSSIGVEPFDAGNEKSLALKEALRSSVVRQITTRDDLDSVRKYVEGTAISVAHVADPAVFADAVFGDRHEGASVGASVRRTRIGLVVTRTGLFKDNGIRFAEADQRELWLDLIRLLEERGYDYHLFTTGHFSDEAFLESLVRDHGVPAGKVTSTVNSPEELLRALIPCDGIVAFRLHASIAAFAYGIPSIGLSWNFKVPDFYSSIGYANRALPRAQWTARHVLSALERAMAEGVVKDEGFLLSVYTTLFDGLKEVFRPDGTQQAVSFAEFRAALPEYPGTAQHDYEAKVRAKLRRTYQSYNKKSVGRRAAATRALGSATDKARRAAGKALRKAGLRK